MAYEEHTVLKLSWTWILIILSSVLTVGWGMFIMMGIMGDHGSHWDFGTVPDAPGESVYSTAIKEEDAEVPKQIIYPE